MELILERKYKKANYTIGNLYLRPSNTAKQALLPLRGAGGPERGEGLQFFCNTLEPPVDTESEMQTSGSRKAIMPGTYNIRMVYSPKFQERLPMLQGVSGRFGIFIHAGNTPRDSTGCILVGKNTQVGKVLESRKTLDSLLAQIYEALNKSEKIELKIQ